MNKIDKIGFQRLTSNLVISLIREFNESPSKYLNQYDTFFSKIVLKGKKAFNLLLLDYPDTDHIDADIFINKDTLDEIMSKWSTIAEFNKLKNLGTKNIEILNYLGKKIKESIDKKINFKKLTEEGELSNVFYMIQLDAIFSLYKDICKDSYLTPQLEEKLRCFNSFVTYDIDSKKTNCLQFYLQIQFRETPFPHQVDWLQEQFNNAKHMFIKNVVKIPFLSIKVAEPYLQIEEYKKRLSLEISPHLYVYNPLLVINNVVALEQDEDMVEEYKSVIRKPFNDYKCSVVGKIPFYLAKEMNELDKLAQVQQPRNKSHPLYKTHITDLYEKYINTSDNKNLHQMEKELNNAGVNPSKHFQSFENPLEKYKNYLNSFTNAHSNKNELQKAKKNCKDTKVNNRKPKFIPYSNADNYYPLKYYGMFNQPVPVPISFSTFGQIVENKLFFKFISLSYLKLFVEKEKKKPMSLDKVEINGKYFLNLPLDELNSDIISRDFLNQDGFLILIKESEFHKATPNVKKTDKGSFFNCLLKLVEKNKTYIKILIDDREVLDHINILVFEQVAT